MMVLKNKWKNKFILILFMVGFVFLLVKKRRIFTLMVI